MTNELDQIAMSAALDRIRQLECETVPRAVADRLAEAIEKELLVPMSLETRRRHIEEALAEYRKAVARG